MGVAVRTYIPNQSKEASNTIQVYPSNVATHQNAPLPLDAMTKPSIHWALIGLLTLVSGFRPVSLSSHRTAPSAASALFADAQPTYGLYEVQEELLVKRGVLEENLMKENCEPLKANKPKGAATNKGFGSGSSGGKNKYKLEARSHAKAIKKEGVVRIDNVLSEDLADRMREFVFKFRKESLEEIEAGMNPSDRFANVLLKSNRCDLKIPLGDKEEGTISPAMEVIYNVLWQSPIKDTIADVLGEDALLYELSCLISDPGSQRQVVHPDNPMIEGRKDPSLVTCFMALQDVQLEMGPTVFLPRTHTVAAHADFNDKSISDGGTESPKDRLLRTQKKVLGTLPKGCCSVYDSRLLHCGSANKSNEIRAIFYFSFRSPSVTNPGNPPSIRSDLASAGITLNDLADTAMKTFGKGGTNPFKYD